MNARHLGPVKREILKACKQGILRLANMQKSGISALFRNQKQLLQNQQLPHLLEEELQVVVRLISSGQWEED